ncbi:T9SS type A sorting domain-containing protein [Taibaiella lutea]|uniref:T9SS type A sorting domain-containing protein n=1 Tax=Taibaiella lutea TaxID=2608001 RepID=A0A5M6CMS9_9BACT|nr:T9SS type A sorting domain-containing protein [Taibaiella lutea]KAA5536337.1 T9SS type A sorting domain-containing protein [Taibaiella lutea]
MKKIFSFAVIAATSVLFSNKVNAQMPYNVTTLNEAYVPLANATNLTNGIKWSDTSEFTVPLGFNFQMGGTAITNIRLSETNLLLNGTSGTQSGFGMLGCSLQDRNFLSGTPASPIQYTLTGNTGSRILKLEIKNAGFTTEMDMFSTNEDFVNVQIWFYENSNIVEFRFGASSINHFQEYFLQKVPLGYLKNLDVEMFSFEKFYCLTGNPMSPAIDSTNNLNTPIGLTAYPASGTVYRFKPKTGNTTAINEIEKVNLGNIYPVPANEMLYIDSKASQYEIYSLAGNVVSKGKLSGHDAVSLQQLSAGTYVIRLSNNKNETDTRKFVKQ